MGYLISKPQFKATSDKLSINLFYFKQTKNASFLIKAKLILFTNNNKLTYNIKKKLIPLYYYIKLIKYTYVLIIIIFI